MTTTTRSTMTAMFCAAAVTAQFVGGKATRDALFLTSLDLTALPTMLIATSVCSILLVAAHGRWAATVAPATFVPVAFVASGLLFLAEWVARAWAPSSTAVLLYLHVSGAGPLLASGFWLIATERFDPRTAKRRFGQISGAGTLGGLLGALLSARVAVWGAPAMLPFLAGLQILTAWLVRRFARQLEPVTKPSTDDTSAMRSSRSGLRVVAEAPHLRTLAALVLLGTTSAALVEYLFKARAVETLGPGDHLLRFFSLYYAATSLVTFILQTLLSRRVLERFGLSLTMSTPSIALLGGSISALFAPTFSGMAVTRAGESIFRGSWFRSSYELFYTPMPAAEKRAAKSIIDVAFDRLGDAVGGSLVRVAVLLTPIAASSTILWLAIVASAGAVVIASRLNAWYIHLLENSLVKQAHGLDVSATADEATRRVLRRIHQAHANAAAPVHPTNAATLAAVALDPEILDILTLRSGHRDRVVEVLAREDGVAPAAVPHVIPLLAWAPVADYAFFALRKVAEERVGEIADALLDPNREVAVRSGLARVFSVCVSQRAVDSLVLALEDPLFEVRFQAARSLTAIVEKNPRVRINPEQIHATVLAEVAVGQPAWEGRSIIQAFATEWRVDGIERDPARQSLSHVFSLLSLVLPREPLQIAFRSLHSNDRQLRGTALEYLEEVLPPRIRAGLWPFLVRRPARRADRSRATEARRSSVAAALTELATREVTPRVAGFGAM